jgi:hypothetical protein
LGQLTIDLTFQQVMAILVDQIPLVECDYQRPAGLDHHRQHALVLLGQWLRRVDQHDRHFRGVDRAVCAHRRIELVATGLADLAPQAGSVDEPPDLAVHLDQRVDRIHCCARDIVDHRTFFCR